MYFRRALKLDRHYLSAWTLMGHEYVEMKNTSAAIGQSPLCHLPHFAVHILGDMPSWNSSGDHHDAMLAFMNCLEKTAPNYNVASATTSAECRGVPARRGAKS